MTLQNANQGLWINRDSSIFLFGDPWYAGHKLQATVEVSCKVNFRGGFSGGFKGPWLPLNSIHVASRRGYYGASLSKFEPQVSH